MTQLKQATTQEDADLIAQLAKEIWEEHYTAILGEEQVAYMLTHLQSAAAIHQEILDGKAYFLVENHQTAIGYLSYALSAEQLFLSKLYLKSSSRGNGIGKELIEKLKNTANEANKKTVFLTVNKFNHPTIAVYKKLGFKIIEEQVADIGHGYVMDDYIMEYRLP